MSNFVNLLDIIYPVGSIYLSVSGTSPVNSVGGTWVQIQGAALAASGSGYSTAGNFGGNKAITVKQMPTHNHSVHFSEAPTTLALPSNVGNWNCIDRKWPWQLEGTNSPIANEGGGKTTFHTIMQSMYGNGLRKPCFFEGVGL
jgi:hypothetical protein